MSNYRSTLIHLTESWNELAQFGRSLEAGSRGNIPLLTRVTAHLGIIALIIGGLLFGALDLGVSASIDVEGDAATNLPPVSFDDESGASDLRIAAVPLTAVRKLVEPQRPVRNQIVQYEVQPNDTVSRIAGQFHISPDSILWANAELEDNPDRLSVGQVLSIPPVSGVLYSVQKGDTVASIAQRFKASAEDIINDSSNQGVHDLKREPPMLVAGQPLMVPGGKKPFVIQRASLATGAAPSGVLKGTSSFILPVRACTTQSFAPWHSGVDLAASLGTPVYAADSGYVSVVATGWNYGYGNMILVDHGNGYVTRYAHLSAFAVKEGQSIKKGGLLGRMGSTGHSTGPHLHFEVIYNGTYRNPSYFVGRLPARCPGY